MDADTKSQAGFGEFEIGEIVGGNEIGTGAKARGPATV